MPHFPWLLVFLSAYTLLSAGQQGVLTWLLRAYVPPTRQALVNGALHLGGGLLYGLLVAGAAALSPAGGLGWVGWAGLAATLVRALLFDPALNLSRAALDRRAGQPATPLWAVGTTAATDRALRALAPRLRLAPERLRQLLWLAGAAGALAWLYLGGRVN